MKPEIKKLWVDALRSGTYKQGFGRLKTDQGYCCLGVLTQLCAIDKQLDFDTVADDRGLVLSRNVLAWAHDKEVDYYDQNPIVAGHALSVWNDKYNADFNQIADLIEQYL